MLATNAPTAAPSTFPVFGSGEVTTRKSWNACGVFTGKTGRLIIAVRHSSPSGDLKRSARLRTVCGVSAAYGFPPANANRPNHRHAAGVEELSFGQRLALPVALEIPGHANSLRVIAAKPRMHSVYVFEGIDHCRGSQRVRREPSAGKQKESRNHSGHQTNHRKAPEQCRAGQRHRAGSEA